MQLYDLELSGHAHRARLMASLLNVPLELIPVDLMNGAHKSPEFLAKNPFGQVPVLDDDGFVLYDANAILVYLASQYDPARTWLPTDAKLAAQVQIWLSKAANELANGVAVTRLVTLFGADLDYAVASNKAHALLAIMEQHLSERTWFVGEQPTIADVALYSYTAHVPEGGIDLADYPQVQAWIAQIEALPGFISMPVSDTAAKRALSAA